jgi:hypothetical protein
MPSFWTPTIVPKGLNDQNVYLVVDDFGPVNRAYREVNVDAADFKTVIRDLIAGQYRNPVCVIAFNTVEQWSDDVSADVEREIRKRFDAAYNDVPSTVEAFIEHHVGHAPVEFETGMTDAKAARYRRLALMETDVETVKLLHLLADEAERGVLCVAQANTRRSEKSIENLQPLRGV